MYPEFNKVDSFLKQANLVKETNQQFKDIYELTINRHGNAKVALYINEKGKINGKKYL